MTVIEHYGHNHPACLWQGPISPSALEYGVSDGVLYHLDGRAYVDDLIVCDTCTAAGADQDIGGFALMDSCVVMVDWAYGREAH